MRLPDFEGWAMFAAVADAGSFSGAARALGTAPPAVSKGVARLEAALGLALFHRTTRRVRLTTDGARLLPEAQAMVAAAQAAVEGAREGRGALAGPIRLTAPMSFGIRVLGAPLAEFAATHPAVSLDVMLSDAQCDLIAEGFDLALRIAALPDSSLVTRTVGRIALRLVASPAYVAAMGAPRHPLDLPGHRLIGYGHSGAMQQLRFARGSEQAAITPAGPLSTNNGDLMVPMLVAGQGVAALPEFLVAGELAAGRLTVLLPDWQLPVLTLQIVTPPSGRRPARVAALIAHLAATLKAACGKAAD
jgi:DNA-binding transcriptional LysR family regulator